MPTESKRNSVRTLVDRFESAKVEHALPRSQSSLYDGPPRVAQPATGKRNAHRAVSAPGGSSSSADRKDAGAQPRSDSRNFSDPAQVGRQGRPAEPSAGERWTDDRTFVTATDIIELKSFPPATVQRIPGGSLIPHASGLEGGIVRGGKGSSATENIQKTKVAEGLPPQRKARFIQPPLASRPAPLRTFSSSKDVNRMPVLIEESSLTKDGKPGEFKDEAQTLLPKSKSVQFSPKRPVMPKSVSSGALSSATVDIPAYSVFSRKALPLNLPHLDRYLSSIPKFAFTETEAVLGPKEVAAWREFVDKPEKAGIFSRITRIFRGNRASRKNGEYTSLDDTTPRSMSSRAAKASILPPMHLLPADLTLDDLKLNNQHAAPLITLSALLGSIIDGVLGVEGSSYGAQLMNIEVLRDAIQMLGLALNFTSQPSMLRTTDVPKQNVHGGHYTSSFSDWRTIAFKTVPSILGLDFVSAFGMAIIFFWVLVAICGWALYEFYQMTGGRKGWHEKDDNGEAFDRAAPEDADARKRTGYRLQKLRQSRNYRMTIVFLITSLYVPLSKISIDALSWADSFWPVDNPYTTTDFPNFPPSLNSTTFRNPADFCYTTTMYHNDGLLHLNWAWVIIPVAFITVLILTIWFPFRLYYTVQKMVPKVDKYTELGEKRKDVTAEYQRLVEVDKSPLAFLYNAYRREWSGFKSIYMAVKLANVLCVCLISKDTCLFRSSTRSKMNVIREATQLTVMMIFFVFDTVAGPYIDSLSNNSDWISRITYVLISLYGLLVSLNVPGSAILDGSVLLLTTITCYALNIYFSLINTQFAQRLVKTLQRRLDFSIDFGSPQLDCQKHIARRIWQESISTLLLAGAEFRMPLKKKLAFARLDNSAPYLLDFGGSTAERHVENIKILREIGLDAYVQAIDAAASASRSMQNVQNTIIDELAGPDCYFCPPASSKNAQLASFFGRAIVVPFPFAVVFYYDLGGLATISEETELEAFVIQNRSQAVQESKLVRRMLRALRNQRVYFPHAVSEWTSNRTRPAFWQKRRIRYEQRTQYAHGVLVIQHNSKICWKGHNLSSGFDVSIEYTGENGNPKTKVAIGADKLDFSSDYRLNSALARLFRHNSTLIKERLPHVEHVLQVYRRHLRQEYENKRRTLSYAFLANVLGDDGLNAKDLENTLYATEQQEIMRQLPLDFRGTITATLERLACANRSTTTQRWFLIWDDLYRKNRLTIPQLSKFPQSFSPHYRDSVCYRPMPRASLEGWLRAHDLETGPHSILHPGFLNCLYFVIDEIVFQGSTRVIPVIVNNTRVPFDQLSVADATWDTSRRVGDSKLSSQTYDTGNGTSHDDPYIRFRHAFPFEEAYDQAPLPWAQGFILRKLRQKLHRIGEHATRWFGLTSVEHCHNAPGIALRLHVNRGQSLEVSRRIASEAIPSNRF